MYWCSFSVLDNFSKMLTLEEKWGRYGYSVLFLQLSINLKLTQNKKLKIIMSNTYMELTMHQTLPLLTFWFLSPTLWGELLLSPVDRWGNWIQRSKKHVQCHMVIKWSLLESGWVGISTEALWIQKSIASYWLSAC